MKYDNKEIPRGNDFPLEKWEMKAHRTRCESIQSQIRDVRRKCLPKEEKLKWYHRICGIE
jgi:hypothetical protein